MPSTYTTNNGLEKIATGEQSGTYGTTWATTLDLIDTGLDGSVAIALSGATYTLNTASGTASNGRNKVIVFTGAPGVTCTVTVTPNTAKKLYFIVNNTNQSVIITQGSGGSITVPLGQKAVVYCDGAGSGAAVALANSVNSDQVTEGTNNLFFSNTRVRSAISAAAPVTYNNSTGQFGVETASGSQPGALSSTDWTTFNAKEPAVSAGTSGQYYRGDKTWQTLQFSALSGSCALRQLAQTGATSGQVVAWNGSTWAPATVSAVSGVSSFNGRSGVVTPTSGDYTAAQVTNAVSTAGSYSDPSWITALSAAKVTGLAASATTDTTSASNISSGSLALARLAQSGATSNQVLAWNGSAWAPATAGGTLKTVQRGSVNISVTSGSGSDNVTITAVVLAKSFLLTTCNGGGIQDVSHSSKLTTTTNIAIAVQSSAPAASGTVAVEWQVVEYN